MKIFDIITATALLSCTIVLTVTHWMAYMGDKTVLVNINSIGEATIEAYLLIVTVICGVILVGRLLRRLACAK